MLSTWPPGGIITDAACQLFASVMTAWFSNADLVRVLQYVGRYASLSSLVVSSSM